jgi:hypothetical protein
MWLSAKGVLLRGRGAVRTPGKSVDEELIVERCLKLRVVKGKQEKAI